MSREARYCIFIYRVEEVFENMQREHASKLTVERTKVLKLKMQQENLGKTCKQKVSQIIKLLSCDHVCLLTGGGKAAGITHL